MLLFVAFMYLLFLIPALAILATLGWALRRVSGRTRRALLIFAATLLFAPSLGPATIAVVVVPFGFLLVASLFLLQGLRELVSWTSEIAAFQALSFAVTGTLIWLIARFVLSNNSLERSRER